jgi:hypothetical protein
MASSLFSLAQRAAQKQATRQYQHSAIGRAAAFVRVWSASKRKGPEIETALGNQNAQRLIRDLAQSMAGQTPERYSSRASGLMSQLLGALGPLGEAIRLAVGGSGRSLYNEQLESAIALIRALGGEYVTMDKGSPHYQRGLQAARKVLGVTGGRELDPHQVMERLNEINQQLDDQGGGAGGSGLPPTTGDEWPEEHGIPLVGRDSASYDPEAMEAILNREIKTPDSSNVYSFVYEEETDPSGRFQERSGILYVTFRPWYPGMQHRPNGPGPMYAYFDVAWRKYKAFEAAAKNASAGGAVWEYLRVRGSKWDHRFPYRLVGGVQVPAGGLYVPRKVTQWGLRRRTLPTPGTGRRGFVQSSLPERPWMPNRGELNRGGPNRGEPNRGR